VDSWDAEPRFEGVHVGSACDVLRCIGLRFEARVAAAEEEEVDVKAVAVRFEGTVAVLDLDTIPFDADIRCQCREVFQQYHAVPNLQNRSNDGVPVLAYDDGVFYHGGVYVCGDELYHNFLGV
jgi:hypothetical protein